MKKMSLFQEFKDRGMIAQCTNEEAVARLLDNEKVTFYIGFDPTADSLHIGHFIQMKIMAHMRWAYADRNIRRRNRNDRRSLRQKRYAPHDD